jgi:hypothetical protein
MHPDRHACPGGMPHMHIGAPGHARAWPAYRERSMHQHARASARKRTRADPAPCAQELRAEAAAARAGGCTPGERAELAALAQALAGALAGAGRAAAATAAAVAAAGASAMRAFRACADEALVRVRPDPPRPASSHARSWCALCSAACSTCQARARPAGSPLSMRAHGVHCAAQHAAPSNHALSVG